MFFTVFLKNRNISSKIKRSKVTDYAALTNCVFTNMFSPNMSCLSIIMKPCFCFCTVTLLELLESHVAAHFYSLFRKFSS